VVLAGGRIYAGRRLHGLSIPAGRINQAHCDKIRLGWTHAQGGLGIHFL
jgi:hypothetical protein